MGETCGPKATPSTTVGAACVAQAGMVPENSQDLHHRECHRRPLKAKTMGKVPVKNRDLPHFLCSDGLAQGEAFCQLCAVAAVEIDIDVFPLDQQLV